MLNKRSIAVATIGVALITGFAVTRPGDAQTAAGPNCYLPEYAANGPGDLTRSSVCTEPASSRSKL